MAENSFDVVCKVDMQEVTNALDPARREIETRYDLKGTKNEVTQEKNELTVLAADAMKLRAVVDILQSKLHRRGVPLKALSFGDVESAAGGALRQKITLQQALVRATVAPDPGETVLEHPTRQELTELPFDELREADTLAGLRRRAQEGLQVLADDLMEHGVLRVTGPIHWLDTVQ